MTKIFYARHGHSFHNELYETIGEKAWIDPSVIGSSLTLKGIEQTKLLKEEIQKLETLDLILVSPLDRCLQTVEQIVKDMVNIPEVIALDELIEYEITDAANYRKDKKELVRLFPFVNFKYIVDEFVTPFEDNRELLTERINSFKSFVSMLSYNRILVVGHTSWLNMLFFNDPDCSELEHCKIYEYPGIKD